MDYKFLLYKLPCFCDCRHFIYSIPLSAYYCHNDNFKMIAYDTIPTTDSLPRLTKFGNKLFNKECKYKENRNG